VGVQQYAPNWGAQQVATIIGGNTLAAIMGVQNGVSGIGTPQVATIIGANSVSTLMSAQQNQQMFGSNQAANVNGAQVATVNGAQQMAQALGMGHGQMGFILQQPTTVAGINAVPNTNNMGNAFIPPYPAGGATWPAPGGFGGSAQNPTAYAAGQVQEQHTQMLSNIMVMLSGLQQNVNMLGMNNMMQGTILSSTKSMKMLSRASKYQVIAWTGLTLQDEVPELLRILDSNESMTIKMQVLEN